MKTDKRGNTRFQSVSKTNTTTPVNWDAIQFWDALGMSSSPPPDRAARAFTYSLIVLIVRFLVADPVAASGGH